MQKHSIEINLIEHDGKMYLDVSSISPLVQLLARTMLPDVPPPPPPERSSRDVVATMLPDVPPPPPR